MAVQAQITYLLSEKGRRDSLRKGGDGRRVQTVFGPVEDADLDVFTVNAEGDVHSDLTVTSSIVMDLSLPAKCQYVLTDEDTFEIPWDQVPSWSDLVGVVRAYEEALQQEDQKSQTREDKRAQLAKTFLEDPTARAMRLESDYVVIEGETFRNGEPVTNEARRRWSHDQEELRKSNRATLAAWIEQHGSENQWQRLAAGLLPWQEAYQSMEAQLYEPLTVFPLYKRFDPEEVCECLKGGGELCKVKFQSVDATELTADQWERFSQIKTAAPGATFQLREHRAQCQIAFAPELRRGVIVKFAIDQLGFKREFAL